MADIAQARNDWSVITEDDLTDRVRDAVAEIAQRHGGSVTTGRDDRPLATLNGYSRLDPDRTP